MKKKYNCPHKANTKDYHNWYNRHIRGRTEAKPRIRWKCMVCGMRLSKPDNLSRFYNADYLVQIGFSYAEPLKSITNPALKEKELKRIINYQKQVAGKLCFILNKMISDGIIDEQFVKTEVGIKEIIPKYEYSPRFQNQSMPKFERRIKFERVMTNG